MRIFKQNIVLSILNSTLISYLCPINLTYFWNFGAMAGILMASQIVTGIFLAMHYVSHVDLAFSSVEHIMRDVNNGWLLRYLHSNGASIFFLAVYIHIFRGLLYGSFLHPRQFLWLTGVVILLLMILTAFLGYVLPWGQMSFWAATVITNLASAVPFVGDVIVSWLWGGFAVDNATLNRFFSLHYFFPFLIAAMVILHIAFLHQHGSSNPLGLSIFNTDSIYFHPYYTLKDILGLFFFLFVYFFFVFFYPNVLGHSDNYIPANPLVTPNHIVPEWYFLPFYAMLRSIPNKLLGVIVLLLSIIIILCLPFLYYFTNLVFSKKFIFLQSYKFLVWCFFFSCLILGWIGGELVETPFYQIGQIFTFLYFFYFFIFALLQLIYFSNILDVIKGELEKSSYFSYVLNITKGKFF